MGASPSLVSLGGGWRGVEAAAGPSRGGGEGRRGWAAARPRKERGFWVGRGNASTFLAIRGCGDRRVRLAFFFLAELGKVDKARFFAARNKE